MRALLSFALVCACSALGAVVAAGCSNDVPPTYILGADGVPVAVSASPVYAPGSHAVARPQVPKGTSELVSVACGLSVPVSGSALLAASGLATAPGRVFASIGGVGFAYASDGACPAVSVAGPFGSGAVALTASAAGVFVASANQVAVFTSQGKALAACSDVRARNLSAEPQGGRVFAVGGRAELQVLSLEAGACVVEQRPLPAGVTALAVAGSANIGTVWIAGVSATNSAFIQRYLVSSGGATGALPPEGIRSPALCSVDSLAEIDGRLVVADGTCARVLTFDLEGTLLGAASAPAGLVPRAVAAAPDGVRALVAFAAAAGGGAVSFRSYSLP